MIVCKPTGLRTTSFAVLRCPLPTGEGQWCATVDEARPGVTALVRKCPDSLRTSPLPDSVQADHHPGLLENQPRSVGDSGIARLLGDVVFLIGGDAETTSVTDEAGVDLDGFGADSIARLKAKKPMTNKLVSFRGFDGAGVGVIAGKSFLGLTPRSGSMCPARQAGSAPRSQHDAAGQRHAEAQDVAEASHRVSEDMPYSAHASSRALVNPRAAPGAYEQA